MTGCTSINTLIFVGTASCCSLEGSEQRGVDMRAHLVVQRVHGRGGARGLERGGPHASILRRIGRFSACSMLLHRRCARRRRTVVAGTLRPLLSTRIFDAWPPIALSHTRGIDKSTMRAEQGDRIAALAQHIREWIDRRFALQREHVRGRDGRRQQAPARLEGAYGRGGFGGQATNSTRPAASAPASVGCTEALQQAARRSKVRDSSRSKVHRSVTELAQGWVVLQRKSIWITYGLPPI